MKCPTCGGKEVVEKEVIEKEQVFEWACPECGASCDHGKGECKNRRPSECVGLVCECGKLEDEMHGMTLSIPCEYAVCDHCGWEGSMPHIPKKKRSRKRSMSDLKTENRQLREFVFVLYHSLGSLADAYSRSAARRIAEGAPSTAQYDNAIRTLRKVPEHLRKP